MTRDGTYKGKGDSIVTVPISPELHKALRVHAAEEGRTIKWIVTRLIERHLAAQGGLVPAVWPLGHGCVLTSFAIAEGVPMFFMRAVSDDHVSEPGAMGTHDVWDSLADAPTLTLAFADLSAVERHIASVTELAAALRAQTPGGK